MEKLSCAEIWQNYFNNIYLKGETAKPRFPDENLVRLVKGRYVELPKTGRVLDVGFGGGANLIMCAQQGFEAYGLEVCQEIVDAVRKQAEQLYGINLNLDVLTDTNLPYPDGYFDIIISWNAVYYFGKRSLVQAAITEFHRALRPGGVLLLSVIHPNSWMVRRLSDRIGDEGGHLIDRPSEHDNRFGMEIFYDGTSSGWRRLLSDFKTIEEGYAEADLFAPGLREAWRLFMAIKG
jgi:SAM-dependent methyltransferase